MWKVYKDDYVTRSSPEIAPVDFWGKEARLLKLKEQAFALNWLFNGTQGKVTSYTIDLPYSCDRRFLSLVLMIHRVADASIFEIEFVKVSVCVLTDTVILSYFHL